MHKLKLTAINLLLLIGICLNVLAGCKTHTVDVGKVVESPVAQVPQPTVEAVAAPVATNFQTRLLNFFSPSPATPIK